MTSPAWRRGIFPGLVAVIVCVALQVPGWDLAALLGLPPERGAGLAPLPVILLVYPTIVVLERLATHRRDWQQPHRDVVADALHLALTGPLSAALYDATIRAALVSSGTTLAATLGLPPLWPSAWPLAAQLALAIAIAELGHYLFHRLAHEVDLVWRLHATHHSAQRLYWLNATRFHPLDLLTLIVVQSTPLLLLGIDPAAFTAYAVFAAAYGQIQHCNVDAPTGRWIDWLFSTPALHRWHHSIDVREGNNNYGAILNLWDHAFGTYFRPADRAFTGRVGIADMPAFPTGYLGHLLAPVRWGRLRAKG